MNLQEKIIEAGKIMDHVASRNHMGPYNGIVKVIGVLRDQIAGKPIIPDTITSEDVGTLKSLQFTEEEIIALDKTRTKNRNRIQAIMARLIDDKHRYIYKAKVDIEATFKRSVDSPFLTTEEIEFLKSENCRKVDVDYVMTNIRIDAVKSLLEQTSLNAEGAFKYIGHLDGPATKSLGLEIIRHQQALRDYAVDASRLHLSANLMMENVIAATKAGNNTLNLEIVALLDSPSFRQGMQHTLESGELLKPKVKIITISQTYKDTLPPLYNHWSMCSNNNTSCLTSDGIITKRSSLTRALHAKNTYPKFSSFHSVDSLLEKTVHTHQKRFPQSPIYHIHAMLQNISAQYNVSLSSAANTMLDVLTRNITQAAYDIQTMLGGTRMTYVYIGCEKNRMLAANKLVAAQIPTDIALRVVSTSSLHSIENTVDVLTGQISYRDLEGMFSMDFEAFTEDQLAALDYMRSLGVNDTSTALAFLQNNRDDILNKNRDSELSNYTSVMHHFETCDTTLMNQVVVDGNDLLTKIAYDILLIPIAEKFVACFDKLPAVAQLLLSTGQAATELFTPVAPTNDAAWIDNKTAGWALIGTGMVSLAALGYLFFKKKPEVPVRNEKVYNADEEMGLIAKHGKGK